MRKVYIMLRIGLTGGIGCGKSTVTATFHEKGITIIDADKIARELVESDPHILHQISASFGRHILNKDGSLNRGELKKQIFSDNKKLKQLEKILHPRIQSEIKLAIQEQVDKDIGSSDYIIVDIPLLIEKNYQPLFDEIVVVDCTVEQQIKRVQQRDDIDLKTIQAIIDKQVCREERLKHASFVLDNSGTKEQLIKQINLLHTHFIDLSR